MAKRRKIEAITGESELPEPIIQHIQSFLSAKRAAQTTVLSKSWREAWLTRPNFDFDERYFPRKYHREISELFSNFMTKTIQRYEESNLKIESLRLFIQFGGDLWSHGNDFVNELILRCLKMGATKIKLRINNDREFVLSPDVFRAENLVGLSVKGCIIDLDQMEDPRAIRCSGPKGLISSRSLERLSFGLFLNYEHKYAPEKFRVTFDVPSIRVFKFEGSTFPSFSFKSTSREWESRLSISHHCPTFSTSWFLKLRKMLLELSPSKIHLSLLVHSNKRSYDYKVKRLEGLRKPVLENLTFMDTNYSPEETRFAQYDIMFLLCRPKIITQYVPRKSSFRDDFLCRTLVLEMDRKCSSRCMRGLHDLKKIYVQIFDNDAAVWRDLPWEEFLNASASRKYEQKMCFHLKWNETVEG